MFIFITIIMQWVCACCAHRSRIIDQWLKSWPETGSTSHKGHKGPPTNLSCHNISDTLSCYIMSIIGKYEFLCSHLFLVELYLQARSRELQGVLSNCHRYHQVPLPNNPHPTGGQQNLQAEAAYITASCPTAGLVIQIDQGLKCTDSQDSWCTACDANEKWDMLGWMSAPVPTE